MPQPKQHEVCPHAPALFHILAASSHHPHDALSDYRRAFGLFSQAGMPKAVHSQQKTSAIKAPTPVPPQAMHATKSGHCTPHLHPPSLNTGSALPLITFALPQVILQHPAPSSTPTCLHITNPKCQVETRAAHIACPAPSLTYSDHNK